MTVSVKKNVNGTTVEQTQKLILYSMYETLEEQFNEQRMAVDILTHKVKNSKFIKAHSHNVNAYSWIWQVLS